MAERAVIDLTGYVSGRLTVISRAPDRFGRTAWTCRCECGRAKDVIAQNLRNGNSKSCGCGHRESASKRTTERNTTHGLSKQPEYVVWKGIKQRCYDPNYRQYKDYGGRGVTMSDEWRHSFQAFFADMGPRPSKRHQIERRDNDGPYSRANCVWATPQEQALNTRKTLIAGSIRGRRAIAATAGISEDGVYQRQKRGWPRERLADPRK